MALDHAWMMPVKAGQGIFQEMGLFLFCTLTFYGVFLVVESLSQVAFDNDNEHMESFINKDLRSAFIIYMYVFFCSNEKYPSLDLIEF